MDGEHDHDRAAVVDEDRVKSRNLDAAQHSLEAIEFRTLQTPHLDPPLNRWSLTVRATGAVGKSAPPVATTRRRERWLATTRQPKRQELTEITIV